MPGIFEGLDADTPTSFAIESGDAEKLNNTLLDFVNLMVKNGGNGVKIDINVNAGDYYALLKTYSSFISNMVSINYTGSSSGFNICTPFGIIIIRNNDDRYNLKYFIKKDDDSLWRIYSRKPNGEISLSSTHATYNSARSELRATVRTMRTIW